MHEPPRAQLKLSHGIRRFQTALCGLQWIQASSRCVWLGWWRHRGRSQMASEPLQRDLPGVLCLGRVLAIEDMAPAGDHDQFDVTAQGCQTRCQALGLIHGRSPLAGLPHHPGSAGVSEVRGGCWRGAVAAPVGCARKGPAQKCRLFFLSAWPGDLAGEQPPGGCGWLHHHPALR